MMGVTLFSFLLVGSQAALAGNIDLPKNLVPTANIEQPLLDGASDLSEREISALPSGLVVQAPTADIDQSILYSSLTGRKIPVYRGGVEKLINNTVAIETQGSLGAGTVLDDESASRIFPQLSAEVLSGFSFIVSNFHVVEEGVAPVVTFAPTGVMDVNNSERTTGEVIAVLPSKDLVLISVRKKPEHVTGVRLGTSESVRIGDDVEAIGHPMGELWTYSRGYVSQIRQNYSWNYNESYELSADVIQTQTPISSGNSGGPLFSKRGELIGVMSFGSDGGENLNFAVAGSELRALSEAVEKSLEVQSVSDLLTYRDLPNLLSTNYALIDSGISDGFLYQKYQMNSNEDVVVLALFEDKESPPVILYEQPLEDTTVTILLDADHQNPGAYFKAQIIDEDGEVFATGWDFDGDFSVDYLL
jgi:S1-C subfamily serine protease